jgi:hypothetical protein
VWRACQPETAESIANRRPRARRAEPDEIESQPAGLPVVLVVAAVAVMGGVWLWDWWRRRTDTAEPEEPTDERAEPPWPASA